MGHHLVMIHNDVSLPESSPKIAMRNGGRKVLRLHGRRWLEEGRLAQRDHMSTTCHAQKKKGHVIIWQ